MTKINSSHVPYKIADLIHKIALSSTLWSSSPSVSMVDDGDDDVDDDEEEDDCDVDDNDYDDDDNDCDVDDNESHWRRLVAVDTGDNSFSEQQLALKQ